MKEIANKSIHFNKHKVMDKDILICGDRSFVAKGIYEKLEINGFSTDCFSRGKEEKNGYKITGDVYQMASNRYLKPHYDIVVNFILLKDQSIEKNLQYIKELVNFCRYKTVKALIHISSIIVYNNNETVVNETTEIENNTNKTGYGAIKIEVDKYLQFLDDLPFQLTFIRPGYVLAEGRPVPYIKELLLRFAVIKGDKKSMQPVVHREDVHAAIINMIKFNVKEQVCLFVPSDNKSKYEYARENYNFRFLCLPKFLILGLTRICVAMKFINKSFYTRIEGMFIDTQYDSRKTERLLKVKF